MSDFDKVPSTYEVKKILDGVEAATAETEMKQLFDYDFKGKTEGWAAKNDAIADIRKLLFLVKGVLDKKIYSIRWPNEFNPYVGIVANANLEENLERLIVEVRSRKEVLKNQQDAFIIFDAMYNKLMALRSYYKVFKK